MELGPVSSFQRVLCQASMEMGPEDVSLLERCSSYFRVCYSYV